MNEERFVLYLHGRGSEPGSPPGDLVASYSWSEPVVAPALTADWLALPFADLVGHVDDWLEASVLAIGHSFGAWLLLCAAVERSKRGVSIPRLCLLAPILGKGFNDKTGIGYFAPRARLVRSALGLDGVNARECLQERIHFVHAERDDQTSIGDAYKLRSLGYAVTLLPGGHRLDHPQARADVPDILRGFLHHGC